MLGKAGKLAILRTEPNSWHAYICYKQEMSVEVEGVEHSQYSGEGSLCWFGITDIVLIDIICQKFIHDCHVHFLSKCMNPKGLYNVFFYIQIINVEKIESKIIINKINIIKYQIK